VGIAGCNCKEVTSIVKEAKGKYIEVEEELTTRVIPIGYVNSIYITEDFSGHYRALIAVEIKPTTRTTANKPYIVELYSLAFGFALTCSCNQSYCTANPPIPSLSCSTFNPLLVTTAGHS
ncbi:unnamed protein product, partial [marine sediment metagenome]